MESYEELGKAVEEGMRYLPDTLEVHRTNLDNMSCLLTLQDAISSSPGHTCHVE
jgi:hypothetical protein